MHTAPTLGVVTTDRHFAIRGWNGWVAAATGLTESDVIGRSVLEFVAPDRREADFWYLGCIARRPRDATPRSRRGSSRRRFIIT